MLPPQKHRQQTSPALGHGASVLQQECQLPIFVETVLTGRKAEGLSRRTRKDYRDKLAVNYLRNGGSIYASTHPGTQEPGSIEALFSTHRETPARHTSAIPPWIGYQEDRVGNARKSHHDGLFTHSMR